MLSVRGVTKRYGKNLALEGATFDLAAGQVLAAVGSNGAGKSTLIKAIAGLIRYEGEIFVDGIEVRRSGREARQRIGYLPQSAGFHGDLSVRETAVFYASLRGLQAPAARAAIEAVGLLDHAEKQVGALSGGMRQRLGLAIAQLGDPPLLVLDEPATGLDVAARLDLREFIREQRSRGKTVLLSTHWLEDVPAIADSVLMLEDGRVAFSGTAQGFAARTLAESRMYLRLNGHSADAVSLIEASAIRVARSGEWLVITCSPEEKATVLESVVGAGISILDLRVEDAALTRSNGTAESGGAS